ncbi:hypothetical protein FOA43_003438 [Brettanomyces nanus]|uniref:ER membrane protein complex subunit 4 n=1 Tax=Eeniella nana TaxID=13502 RepID=A0A875S807_EENNA|nr:uncharacterized protein FOA43_003438 [Brettanomyces nanus]QPG76052.1 hypothetical protein FOA43_003438 [Brettanomyces nanus]
MKMVSTDNRRTNKKHKQKDEALESLKMKKLWEMAIQPSKNIPMNAIMMYMTPNSIQIISIMMMVMLFVGSLKDIFAVQKKFKNAQVNSRYDFFVLKGIYVLCCSGNLLVGLWKLNAMGLIPNQSSDWLTWETKLGNDQTVVL